MSMLWISSCLLREGFASRGVGSVKPPQERNGWVRAERDYFTPKAAGVKANRTLDALSDGAFAATPERSRSHREAQHAKLRPSTQQRDIVPYQSTLSGENRSSSPGKSNVRNAHLLTSFSQSLKARYEIAQRFA